MSLPVPITEALAVGYGHPAPGDLFPVTTEAPWCAAPSLSPLIRRWVRAVLHPVTFSVTTEAPGLSQGPSAVQRKILRRNQADDKEPDSKERYQPECGVGRAARQVTFTTRDVVLEKLHECNADITNENGRWSYRTNALTLNSRRKRQCFYQSSASFHLEKGWWTAGAGQALPAASASIAGGDPQLCRPEAYDTVLRETAYK
ncbi:unnamed protein product [Rangifer tarandus platyrhynchus]|uniref:Uncharacterized protein n=1 Tax=Rangifer tarandus platyrhynchus TaxID=3082113 RepID=A0ABN8Y807_RANTA|nr:unnamed protein product [Rangifer tarandus platyrhynchus]